MGEILGIGATHYPGLVADDEHMIGGFFRVINAPRTDSRYKDKAHWPPEMVAELGEDGGIGATRRYRERMWKNFRELRRLIDDFAPDFIVMFGDDQYENFREDIIPPFCIFGLDNDYDLYPWRQGVGAGAPNTWGESKDTLLRIHGHREGAKYLTTGIIQRGIPMPYAYKPLHSPMISHAFIYTVLYLDCDRRGFPHPIVPCQVNCIGSSVISSGGAMDHLFREPRREGLPDPPAPSPALCMEVGAKMAQAAAESPYRIVLMASSSWSHCFLSADMGYAIPDHKSDRLLLDALKRGDYGVWRNRSLEAACGAGQHEMLNWWVLAGAMEELGRKPVIHDWVETHVFLSNKCFASFPAA